MEPHLERIGAADVRELAVWWAAESWPFHRDVRVSEAWVRERAEAGMFYGDGVVSLWLVVDGTRAGVGRIFELGDATPLLDLRLAARYRGRGLGVRLLSAVTEFAFAFDAAMTRLGGYTRQDNVAMQRTFERCGYRLEARHRLGWVVPGQAAVDALGYAILRDEIPGTRAPGAERSSSGIRAFRAADEAQVIALWERCGLTRPWNDPRKDIARKLTVQPELFFVLELHGAVVGSVMAGYEGHRGWMNYLAVSPDAQKRGYGRALVEHAERALQAIGCPKLNLQVRSSNAAVIDFYRGLGYVDDSVVSLGKRFERDGPK